MSARTFTCADCGKVEHWLCEFPQGRCVDCHAAATAGEVVTADEVRRAFGRAVTA